MLGGVTHELKLLSACAWTSEAQCWLSWHMQVGVSQSVLGQNNHQTARVANMLRASCRAVTNIMHLCAAECLGDQITHQPSNYMSLYLE